MAATALAQAGPTAGAAGARPLPQPGAADSGAAQSAPGEQQRTAPSGCPYRDGKLELIV